MDLFRHAGALAPEQQPVVGAKGEVGIGGGGPGGQQNQPRAMPDGAVGLPAGVADELDRAEIVHAGATQPSVVEDEAAGLDDVDRDAEAGGEAEQRAGILRDVRLVEDEAHGAGFGVAWQGYEVRLYRFRGRGRRPRISASVCRRTGGVRPGTQMI